MGWIRIGRADGVALALVGIGVLVLAGIAPRAFDVPVRPAPSEVTEGVVLRLVAERAESTPRGTTRVRVLEVAAGGGVVTVEESAGDAGSSLAPARPGDRVILEDAPGPDGVRRYFIADYARRGLLVVLTAAFLALVFAVGRWHGVRSLLGLVASFLILMRFVLPGILAGHSPLAISMIGGVGIMAATLTLAHGANRKSAAAIGGTALALVAIVLLSEVAIDAARFTGLADEHAGTVFVLFGGTIDARGLLLAGILIGALGALDDVTMTQSSTVFELRSANPELARGELYRRAMRVGRDHISAIVNTLVLAYAGASLPLLVILASQAEGAGTLVSREFLATEIVRTLVGSFGIVAAVPLTTALAAAAAAALGAPPGDGAPPRYVPVETLDEEEVFGNLRPERPSILR